MHFAHRSEGVGRTDEHRPLHFGLAKGVEVNQKPSCFVEGRFHGDSPGEVQHQFTAQVAGVRCGQTCALPFPPAVGLEGVIVGLGKIEQLFVAGAVPVVGFQHLVDRLAELQP